MAGIARWSIALLLSTVAVLSPLARGDVTSGEVEGAIREGIRYLRQSQLASGSWRGEEGVTELATLALLTAGVSPDDPDVARALALISQSSPDRIAPSHKTYTVALHAMALAAANPEGYRDLIARDAAWLVNAQSIAATRVGPQARVASGSWTYRESRGGVVGDNSNTQYALLGLNAASEAGIPIPAEVWQLARLHWELCQQADGGWGYRAARGQSTASMTTAGISSMVIVGSKLSRSREFLTGPEIRHCGSTEMRDDALHHGINWLADHFSVRASGLYYLYGLERAGRLARVRFFGTHDWYREGAEELVMIQQRATGAWQDTYGPEISTSFALLFLAKGRAPVLINKLRHAPRGDWNNDASDVGNIVGVVARDWKSLLTWQIVDPDGATVEDLLQAPILFFNGHEPPWFGERGKKNLRTFVEQGGFILAEACCSRPAFDQGFRALIKEIFPEPGYDLHPLGADHPIWRAKNALDPGIHPLWGIEYGCRTMVVYSPEDLSCYWNQAENSPANPAVLKAIKVGQNIIDFATGRELPADKLVVREVNDFKADSPKRGALRVAKLKHAGEWNLAPLAIPNLMAVLRKPPLNFDVVLSQKDLAPSDPSLVNYPLIYLHGRTAFDLSADLNVLRRHLEPGGGTIFADAACGSLAFDAAFRQFVAELLPKHPLVPIPHDDEIYTRKVGFDLSDVQYSKAAGGSRGYPQLEGVHLNGHWAVIYSKYDLGCALENHQILECKGYTHESALRIAANIVVYSTLP